MTSYDFIPEGEGGAGREDGCLVSLMAVEEQRGVLRDKTNTAYGPRFEARVLDGIVFLVRWVLVIGVLISKLDHLWS